MPVSPELPSQAEQSFTVDVMAIKQCAAFFDYLKTALIGKYYNAIQLMSTSKFKPSAGTVSQGFQVLGAVTFPVIILSPLLSALGAGVEAFNASNTIAAAEEILAAMGGAQQFERYIENIATELTIQYHQQLSQLRATKEKQAA